MSRVTEGDRELKFVPSDHISYGVWIQVGLYGQESSWHLDGETYKSTFLGNPDTLLSYKAALGDFYLLIDDACYETLFPGEATCYRAILAPRGLDKLLMVYRWTESDLCDGCNDGVWMLPLTGDFLNESRQVYFDGLNEKVGNLPLHDFEKSN